MRTRQIMREILLEQSSSVTFADDFWYLPGGEVLPVRWGYHPNAVHGYFRQQVQKDWTPDVFAENYFRDAFVVELLSYLNPGRRYVSLDRLLDNFYDSTVIELEASPINDDELGDLDERELELDGWQAGLLDAMHQGPQAVARFLNVPWLLPAMYSARSDVRVRASRWRRIGLQQGWVRHAGGEGDQVAYPTPTLLRRIQALYQTVLRDVPDGTRVILDFAPVRGDYSTITTAGRIRDGLSGIDLVRARKFPVTTESRKHP